MSRPVLLVVASDARSLVNAARELERRYTLDYEIARADSVQAALGFWSS